MSIAQDIIAKTQRYGARNYATRPVVLDRGEGVWVWDVDGKKYLDMLACYSALNLGHQHEGVTRAVVEQSQRLAVTSRAFHNPLLGEFFAALVAATGLERVLPMNSGAEAVETAIKAARKWGYEVKGVARDRAEIIACDNNFHGRTTTIVSFSSDDYQWAFGPPTPRFKLVPYADAEALEQAITPETVGFLVEPIQAEGGIIIPPDDYLRRAREICSERRVLLMADEIQTGLGRTGKLFGCDWAGIKPDVMMLGKGLSGGAYPVSAVVSSHEVMDVIKPGQHGSTFGGSPVAAAVGLAALRGTIEEKLPERALELGEYFMRRLRELALPLVREVRGRGLLIGVELTEPAAPYCDALAEKGILALSLGVHGGKPTIIRLTPPLTISREEIDWAVERIGKALVPAGA